MRINWVIWLLATVVTYAAGNECDPAPAQKCYWDLDDYESVYFPLFGKNVAELEDTCGNINGTFECLENYFERCNGAAECNSECNELVNVIKVYLRKNGLRMLAEDLCNEESTLRIAYLDHYACLESNKDDYSACHNDSAESKMYLGSIAHEAAKFIQGRCCYISWYPYCFINATLEQCGEEAASFMEISVKLLQNAGPVCKETAITCDAPPLPRPEKDGEQPTEGMDKQGDASDASTTNNPSKHVGDSNDIHGHSTAMRMQAVATVGIALCFSVLFKFIL